MVSEKVAKTLSKLGRGEREIRKQSKTSDILFAVLSEN